MAFAPEPTQFRPGRSTDLVPAEVSAEAARFERQAPDKILPKMATPPGWGEYSLIWPESIESQLENHRSVKASMAKILASPGVFVGRYHQATWQSRIGVIRIQKDYRLHYYLDRDQHRIYLLDFVPAGSTKRGGRADHDYFEALATLRLNLLVSRPVAAEPLMARDVGASLPDVASEPFSFRWMAIHSDQILTVLRGRVLRLQTAHTLADLGRSAFEWPGASPEDADEFWHEWFDVAFYDRPSLDRWISDRARLEGVSVNSAQAQAVRALAIEWQRLVTSQMEPAVERLLDSFDFNRGIKPSEREALGGLLEDDACTWLESRAEHVVNLKAQNALNQHLDSSESLSLALAVLDETLAAIEGIWPDEVPPFEAVKKELATTASETLGKLFVKQAWTSEGLDRDRMKEFRASLFPVSFLKDPLAAIFFTAAHAWAVSAVKGASIGRLDAVSDYLLALKPLLLEFDPDSGDASLATLCAIVSGAYQGRIASIFQAGQPTPDEFQAGLDYGLQAEILGAELRRWVGAKLDESEGTIAELRTGHARIAKTVAEWSGRVPALASVAQELSVEIQTDLDKKVRAEKLHQEHLRQDEIVKSVRYALVAFRHRVDRLRNYLQREDLSQHVHHRLSTMVSRPSAVGPASRHSSQFEMLNIYQEADILSPRQCLRLAEELVAQVIPDDADPERLAQAQIGFDRMTRSLKHWLILVHLMDSEVSRTTWWVPLIVFAAYVDIANCTLYSGLRRTASLSAEVDEMVSATWTITRVTDRPVDPVLAHAIATVLGNLATDSAIPPAIQTLFAESQADWEAVIDLRGPTGYRSLDLMDWLQSVAIYSLTILDVGEMTDLTPDLFYLLVGLCQRLAQDICMDFRPKWWNLFGLKSDQARANRLVKKALAKAA